MNIQLLPSGDPTTWTLACVNLLIHNAMNLAFLLASGIATVYLIWGGISYLTAYGNEERANAGKKTIMWAVIGLVVIITSQVIVAEIFNFLGSSYNLNSNCPTSSSAASPPSVFASPPSTTAAPQANNGLTQSTTQNPLNVASANPNATNSNPLQSYLGNNLSSPTTQQIQQIGNGLIKQLPTPLQSAASHQLNSAQNDITKYLGGLFSGSSSSPSGNPSSLYGGSGSTSAPSLLDTYGSDGTLGFY